MLGDVEVVGDEIALRQPALWEENLAGVRNARSTMRIPGQTQEGNSEMRNVVIAVAALVVLVAAAASTAHSTPAAPAAVAGCPKDSLNLVEDGVLTIGTDNPAYPPWFGGGELKGS